MKSNEFQQDFLDLIGELGNISFGSASTALNTMLGEDIDISTPKVEVITKNDLIKTFPNPYVLVEVEYTEGLEGHNVLLLKPKDASIISNLMMGGDGKEPSESLSELEISAVQEAMNQMMGSASTSMSQFLNKTIDILPPNLVQAKLNQNEALNTYFNDENLIKVSFDLTIGDLTKSTFMQVINLAFAKQLANELLGI